MNNKIQQIRRNLEREKGRAAEVKRAMRDTKIDIKESKRSLRRHEQAREIVNEVGLKTQQQLQFHISNITSLALEAVFDDPYQLVTEFVHKRNKAECDLYFTKNKTRIDPLLAGGGGAVDIAAFALRIASWSMQTPLSRNTIILDEPFKHLKGREANLRVLQMVNKISKELNKKNGGVQIIMISDERVRREDIIDNADRVFEVSIKNGISNVEKL